MILSFGSLALANICDPGVKNFRINGRRIVQQAPHLRAALMSHYDRGNKLTTISFEIQRGHADTAEAIAFVATHPLQIPDGNQDCQIVANDGSQNRGTFNMPGALMEDFDGFFTGASTTFSYVIIGGAFS